MSTRLRGARAGVHVRRGQPLAQAIESPAPVSGVVGAWKLGIGAMCRVVLAARKSALETIHAGLPLFGCGLARIAGSRFTRGAMQGVLGEGGARRPKECEERGVKD
ncbi:hypothetical protein [Sphingobium scionense]|uniref:hypothetical protein n=1 Tax=Sphingobium scionense TaxID=1404341 RepID=UPI003608BF7E